MSIAKETQKKLMPPGPPGWPLLGWRGNALRMALDQMDFLLKLYQDYGPIVSLARGTARYVFVFGPEYNHQILSNSEFFHNPSVTEGTMPFKSPPGSAAERLSVGLPLQNEDNHKRLRRLMQPVFQRKRVETYRDAMVEVTNRHLADWSVGQVKNIISEMRQLSLSVAIKTLVGIDPIQADQTLRRLIGQWMDLSFDPLTILFPMNLPGTPFRRFLRVSERLEIELLKLVQQKRQQSTDSGDVLARLLTMKDEDGTSLSDLEVVGQLPALFVAGHETTASTLSWILFLLSQQPQILEEGISFVTRLRKKQARGFSHWASQPVRRD